MALPGENAVDVPAGAAGPAATGHSFRSGDLRLHYLHWGSADGLPIVALHGLRAYAQTWQSLAGALAEDLSHPCRLYALDQRGRGESDWGPVADYRTEVYVRDLENLVAHLGLDEFVLIGHSLGGTNALEYARLHPDRVRAMVIEDIGPGSSAAGEGAQRIRREMRETPMSFADWDAARAFWRSARPNLGEAGLASRLAHSMCEDGGRIRWKHDQQGIAEARLTITPTDLWPAVDAVRCPTLLIKGADSDFLPVATLEAVEARNPRFRPLIIEGATHYVHDDQAQTYNDAVVGFIHQALDSATQEKG